jgi:plastocyanin
MKHLSLGLASSVVISLFVACGSSNNGVGLQPGINGCTAFTDATAFGASRTIRFGDSLGNAYDQKCLAISAGQSVTFSGSFQAHPLRPGLAPSQRGGPDAGSPNNPISNQDNGSTYSPTFPTAGTYPYYCSAHENLGMFGTIQAR